MSPKYQSISTRAAQSPAVRAKANSTATTPSGMKGKSREQMGDGYENSAVGTHEYKGPKYTRSFRESREQGGDGPEADLFHTDGGRASTRVQRAADVSESGAAMSPKKGYDKPLYKMGGQMRDFGTDKRPTDAQSPGIKRSASFSPMMPRNVWEEKYADPLVAPAAREAPTSREMRQFRRSASMRGSRASNGSGGISPTKRSPPKTSARSGGSEETENSGGTVAEYVEEVGIAGLVGNGSVETVQESIGTGTGSAGVRGEGSFEAPGVDSKLAAQHSVDLLPTGTTPAVEQSVELSPTKMGESSFVDGAVEKW